LIMGRKGEGQEKLKGREKAKNGQWNMVITGLTNTLWLTLR